jgi:hypothetical protein
LDLGRMHGGRKFEICRGENVISEIDDPGSVLNVSRGGPHNAARAVFFGIPLIFTTI